MISTNALGIHLPTAEVGKQAHCQSSFLDSFHPEITTSIDTRRYQLPLLPTSVDSFHQAASPSELWISIFGSPFLSIHSLNYAQSNKVKSKNKVSTTSRPFRCCLVFYYPHVVLIPGLNPFAPTRSLPFLARRHHSSPFLHLVVVPWKSSTTVRVWNVRYKCDFVRPFLPSHLLHPIKCVHTTKIHHEDTASLASIVPPSPFTYDLPPRPSLPFVYVPHSHIINKRLLPDTLLDLFLLSPYTLLVTS